MVAVVVGAGIIPLVGAMSWRPALEEIQRASNCCGAVINLVGLGLVISELRA
jgi:hypothetical protein